MAHETRSIQGTVVAVTGASSGIGRETARALVEAGAKVAITARRQSRLDELVDELGPENVVAVAGDIADPATSDALVAAAVERFGRLDSLVAAAGVGMYGGVLDNSNEELTEMAAANYLSTVWNVRAAVPHLRDDGGDIVVIASVAGLRGGAHEAVYAGTKAAQIVFAGAIDRELREIGIRVTSLCPAAVNTEFALGKGRTAGDPSLDAVMVPEDVAAAVIYTLQQPRRLRTTQWALWSAAESA
ncbi:MAG: short-chain dehydrogenase/reductase [Microbacteriaceae bacterium]|nr:short-chain dehydrogenase/reductase [Microbacteriaceae bacterium]